MARVPQVTRTIQTTKVKVMCLDIEKCEPFTQEVTLPRTYKDEKTILKEAEKVLGTDTVKVVHVVESTVESVLYGMTEQEFIQHAAVLPPRVSPAEEQTATEEQTANN